MGVCDTCVNGERVPWYDENKTDYEGGAFGKPSASTESHPYYTFRNLSPMFLEIPFFFDDLRSICLRNLLFTCYQSSLPAQYCG